MPEALAKHAETIARNALYLKDAMQEETFGCRPLRLRIEIHSGPAVARVIGRNRFAYDLWGDTVNIAARIEQAAKPNEICLSDATREALGAAFVCTASSAVTGERAESGASETEVFAVQSPATYAERRRSEALSVAEPRRFHWLSDDAPADCITSIFE